MRRSFFIALSAILIMLAGCSEAEFGSDNSGPSGSSDAEPSDGDPEGGPDDGPDGGPDDGPTGNPNECVDGDKINLKFPAEIQSCIDDGNIYDFDRNTCTKVPQADFACEWDTLIDEMTAIGTSSTKTKNGRADGNKLVSCGQSNSGDLIVAQWWDASRSDTANCEFGKGNMLIVTGCYGDLPTSANTDNLSDEERQKVVSDCLKILSD